MSKHPLSLRSERGFSLIQVMIIGGIVLGASASSLKIMDNRTQSLRIARMANRLSVLEERVKNAATAQSAVYLSAVDGNTDKAFSRCLRGGTCRYEAFENYDLYNSFGVPVTGTYNVDGKPCQSASADCPLVVDTSFQILCADGATTCTQPEAIVTNYTIRQQSTAFTKGFKLKPRSGQATLVTHLCPANEYVAGVDAAGKLICEEAYLSRFGTKCPTGAAFAITDRAELRCAEVVDFCNKDVRLISVIDTSGSMGAGKLTAAMASADTFLGKLKANDEGALASFDTVGRSNQPPSKDKGQARGKLKALRAAGGTNMTAGLQEAKNMIAAGGGSVQGIVFLSDGWHNVGPAPFAIADSLKQDGVKIWTIGFGAAADGNTLMRLASSPDNYAFATDAAALDKIYKNIADTMCR